MRVTERHTACMLAWWRWAGVDRADLAVRRPDGVMIWRYAVSLETLPLPWARAENARRAEVYIRAARGHCWPVVFLDDVEVGLARRIALEYAALAVLTSTAGGCHVYLRCQRALDECERRHAQCWLAARTGADRGSVSGEHLGRLAGLCNWRRGGVWVNVLASSTERPVWHPSAALDEHGDGSFRTPSLLRMPENPDRGVRVANDRPPLGGGFDTSESGKEWGWVCGLLEAGYEPNRVYLLLCERARQRRGADANRYAETTVRKATQHCRRPHR